MADDEEGMTDVDRLNQQHQARVADTGDVERTHAGMSKKGVLLLFGLLLFILFIIVL